MGKGLNGKELGKGIRQRKDGRYETRIYNPGTQKYVSLYDTKLQRLKKTRNAYLEGKGHGIAGYDLSITVSQWYGKWMELYIIHNKKNTTINNYVNGYERIREYIGYFKMIDVKPNDILNVIKSLQKEGYKRTTIIHSLTILRLMFQRAFDSKMIPSNPTRDIKLPAGDNEPAPSNIEEDSKCISVKQSEIFFDACKDTRYYELFYLLLNTGIRIGEACALTWWDIDFDNELIYINKTLNQVSVFYDKEGNLLPERRYITQITSPKQSRSRRNVPMSKTVSKNLLDWKAKQDLDKKQYKQWGVQNDLLGKYPDLVFTTSQGCAYTPNAASRECKRIVDKINSKEEKLAEQENRTPMRMYIHSHMFRHTFITRCIQSGLSAETIAKIVGHADIKMTHYYTHIEDDFMKKEYTKFTKIYTEERGN